MVTPNFAPESIRPVVPMIPARLYDAWGDHAKTYAVPSNALRRRNDKAFLNITANWQPRRILTMSALGSFTDGQFPADRSLDESGRG